MAVATMTPRASLARWIAVACALLLAAAGCDSLLTRPSLYNSVDVIVTQRNGDPIPGASLVLYTGQRPMGYATTGADGRYRFERVPQGFYGVLATPPDGYELIEHLVGAPPSDFVDGLVVARDSLSAVRFTFLKRGPGSVRARVVGVGGAPLAGILTVLYSPARRLDSAATDSSGLVTFANVPFGAYGLVLTRPPLYRSFQREDDSLYAYRDGIVVDDGSRDSVRFALARCAGQVRFHVKDQRGAAVAGAQAGLYTVAAVLGNAFTGADGVGSFPDQPCATPMGLFVYPPVGYTVAPGRGSQYIDGFTLTANQTLDLTFTLQKNP